MIGRFDRETRRLKHWSTVPFTVPAASDECDIEFPAGTTLPAPVASVRATADWRGLEIDPTPRPPAPPPPPNTVLGYTFSPPVWIFSEPSQHGIEARIEEVFRRQLGAGLTVSARRCGLFFFDFTRWDGVAMAGGGEPMSPRFDALESLQRARLEVMNAHVACLASAFSELHSVAVEKMEVTPRDLVFGHGGALAGPGLVTIWGMESLPPSSQIVDDASLSRSFELLDALLERDAALPIVALLNRAACYCEERNFPLAVVAAWAISERLLHVRWSRVGGAKKRVPAASILSKLVRSGQLPDRFDQPLTATRNARNDWVHEGKDLDWSAAALAIDTAREMIAEVVGISLRLPLVRVLHS